MNIVVYYNSILEMWVVDYGTRKEYYESEDVAFKKAFGV